jgi:hypothetical protein
MKRLLLLCLLIFTATGLIPLLGQVDQSSDNIRSLPAPDTDQICTLGHNDIDAHFFIRPEPRLRQRMMQEQESDFQVTFVNSCNGSTWPAQAQEAFEYALSIWAVHVQSSIPIRVEAVWDDINSLGSAGPTRIIFSDGINIPGGEPDTWYSIAQASAMANRDYVTEIDLRPDQEESYDITVSINCNTNNWHYGTDKNPGSGRYDLVTVVIHEIGHGLGFIGTMDADNNSQTAEWGISPGNNDNLYPIIYDRFVSDGDEIMVLNESIYPNNSSELYQAVTGSRGGLFFTGKNTNRMLAGLPAQLHAPSPWESGSSYAHVHQTEYSNTENALMRPTIQPAFAIHQPGPAFCGILADKGWPMGSGCREFLNRDAVIAYEPDIIDFELVNMGNPKTMDLAVSNTTTSEDTIQGWAEIEGDEFNFIQGAGTFTIPPGLENIISVQFDPSATGIRNGTLFLYHNAINESNPIEIKLTGEALKGDVLAQMEQNFPNPFDISTRINYGLPEDSDVRIDLYSVTGQYIQTLVNEPKTAGHHHIILESAGLSSGMYFYRIIVNRFAETKKMLLIR